MRATSGDSITPGLNCILRRLNPAKFARCVVQFNLRLKIWFFTRRIFSFSVVNVTFLCYLPRDTSEWCLQCFLIMLAVTSALIQDPKCRTAAENSFGRCFIT